MTSFALYAVLKVIGKSTCRLGFGLHVEKLEVRMRHRVPPIQYRV